MIHTLCCIATGSILYEDVVERLVGPIGQLVDPHGGDPLLTHGALRVPAVDHTVITRPDGRDKTRCYQDTMSVSKTRVNSEEDCCATCKRNQPLVFHDEADRILDLQVFWSATLLHLRCNRMFLVLDVLQCMLYQVTHRPMLGGVQRLNVLQDV